MARADSVQSTEDAVGWYLRQIGRYPLLTPAEEVELAKTIEAGRNSAARLAEAGVPRVQRARLRRDLSDGEAARTRFITSNLRLVVRFVKRYPDAELPLSDRIQLGNIGLMRAVDKFDWRQGYRFSTYAAWWVRQALSVGIEQTARLIRLPRQAREEADLIRAVSRLNPQLASEQRPDDLARHVGMTSARVRQVLRYPSDPTSLDAPLAGTERSLLEVLDDRTGESLSETVERLLEVEALRTALQGLPGPQLAVITYRFGLDGGQSTLSAVAERLGLTVQQVRDHQRTAVAALREALGA